MATETKEITKKEAQQPAGTEWTKTKKVYVPQVDIFEAKDRIVLVADMPGVDEKSVDVVLEKNILTITGSTEAEAHKGYNMTYSEYDMGDYQRAFTISDEVNRDNIEASVKNGVLKITLHKAEKAKAKKISVTAH
jgi:HSP20 family protein